MATKYVRLQSGLISNAIAYSARHDDAMEDVEMLAEDQWQRPPTSIVNSLFFQQTKLGIVVAEENLGGLVDNLHFI